MTERDHEWIDEGVAWQWTMPAKAHPILRGWGFRHVRSWIMLARAYAFPFGRAPTWMVIWYREWLSYAIWRGWC